MRLIVPRDISVGTAMRLDFENQLVLGEVCYCQAAGDSSFIIGLELEQSLSNLDDLARLVRALIGDDFKTVLSTEPASNRSR